MHCSACHLDTSKPRGAPPCNQLVLHAEPTADKQMQAGDRRLLRGIGLQTLMLALAGVALFWAGHLSSLPDTSQAARAHLNWHPQGQSACFEQQQTLLSISGAHSLDVALQAELMLVQSGRQPVWPEEVD